MPDADIRPEPTPEERRAILEALAAEAGAEAATSPWQHAALDVDGDADYATAPPRQSRGATRA